MLMDDQNLTFDFQFELLGEARNPGVDDLADVAARVRLLGVVDEERHVEGGHLRTKANTTYKLRGAESDGGFSVGDDLDKESNRESDNKKNLK